MTTNVAAPANIGLINSVDSGATPGHPISTHRSVTTCHAPRAAQPALADVLPLGHETPRRCPSRSDGQNLASGSAYATLGLPPEEAVAAEFCDDPAATW
jgi:hypothetical protein